MCLCAATRFQHNENGRKGWRWAGDREPATDLRSSWWLDQPKCGVKPSPCEGTDQSTVSEHSRQIQKAFSNLLWWWDRSLLNISGEYNPVLRFAPAHLIPHPLHPPTHPQAQWLLCCRGKMLHGELHIPESSSVCISNRDGSLRGTLNLCRSQISIEHEGSWSMLHLTQTTCVAGFFTTLSMPPPTAKVREPLSLLKPKGGKDFLLLGCRFFLRGTWEIINT